MKQKGEHRSSAMGRDPIWRLLLRFSGPAIISMTVASTYNLVDRIWVGRIPGEEGLQSLSALAYVFPIMIAFMAILQGTGIGAASLISRRLGADDRQGASRVAGTSITLTIVLGALMTAIALPNLDGLLHLMGASNATPYDAAVMALARSYLSVLVVFAIVNAFSLTIGSIIRAEGSPVFPSVVMIIAGITNIILDPILIHVAGLGVTGAALATVAGRAVATLLFAYYYIFGKTSLHLHLKDFLPNLKTFAEIYRVGLASIAQMSVFSFVIILANRTATDLFSTGHVAIMGILFSISSLAVMPCLGLGHGMLPLVGYNYGAGLYKRVEEVVNKAGLAAVLWGILCAMVALLIPGRVMSLFNSDPEFLQVGAPAVRIFAISFFVVGLQIILGSFFQGLGRGIASIVLALSRQAIFLIPAILILPRLFGERGLWASFPAADISAIVLAVIWATVEYRRLGIGLHFK